MALKVEKYLNNTAGVQKRGNVGSHYDPRPDIKDDHSAWVFVLKIAYKVAPETYDVLFAARCYGARLRSLQDDQGPHYRLGSRGWDYAMTWEQYREKFLVPHAEQVVWVLRTAYKKHVEWGRRR